MKFKTNFENFENLSSNSYSFNMNFLYTDRDKRFIKFYEEFLNLPPVSNENFDIYSNIVESTINVSFLNRLNFNLPPVSFTKENYDFSNSDTKTQSLFTTGNSKEKRNYNQIEANYTKTFDKKGRLFTMDFQYDFWNSEKVLDFCNKF